MLKCLTLLLKLLELTLLLLLVSCWVVDIDICVIVIYHHDSAIRGVQLHILELVPCLGPLMGRFLVLLGLDLNLVTQISPVIDAVHHSCGSFYLFLVQRNH